jgi:predicted TIM-barrel fold metal-dependent hydrolase
VQIRCIISTKQGNRQLTTDIFNAAALDRKRLAFTVLRRAGSDFGHTITQIMSRRGRKGMLTRRSVVAGLTGLCVTGTGAFADAPQPKTPVAFKVPRGACDTHVHVIGDPTPFPMSRSRDYTPPPATVDELRSMLEFLSVDRVVIVTPDIYGNDNSATLAAIKELGRDRARGVAWVAETTPPEALDFMRTAGIVGMRVNLNGGQHFDAAVATKRLQAKFRLAQRQKWHLQFSEPPFVVSALKAQFASSPVPIVFTYFGWAEGGVDEPGFGAVLSLIKSGSAYVKLSEPYRLSKKGPDYPDLVPVVRALLAANPDRVLWGSGWPYVSGAVAGRPVTAITPDLPIDAGHLLNLFATWVPDAETRRKILVDNPVRLYGF